MKAGAYQHLVTIEQRSASPRSGIGEEPDTWTTFLTAWASIEPVRGREYVALREAGSEVTTRVRMHFRAGVTPKMRLVHGTDVYSISEALSPLERKRELEILCSRSAE